MHPTAAQWYAHRTSRAADWPVELLRARKNGVKVSVVLPALNEEPTVGHIVERIQEFAARTALVDEIVVMDSGSTDRTAAVAAATGATVCHRDDVLPGYGSRPGKGEVLWKSLAATKGEILVYVDADLTEFGEHYLTGLIGPLLTDPEVMLVKAFYDRPLRRSRYDSGTGAGADSGANLGLGVPAGHGAPEPPEGAVAGGGRVTELAARPLLNAYFPELAGVVQPLGGEYAGRRSLLERLPFAAGYGVEIAMLIDSVRLCGLDAIAQVDLGVRAHKHQDTVALGRMAATILHTVLRRVGLKNPVWTELTQFQRQDGVIVPNDHEVTWPDRPPLASVPEARRRPLAEVHQAGSANAPVGTVPRERTARHGG